MFMARCAWSAIPSTHGNETATLGHYVLDMPANPNDPVDTYRKGKEMLERMDKSFLRTAGELAHLTERVEEALGLPALEGID